MTYDEHKQRQPSDQHGWQDEPRRGPGPDLCRDCGVTFWEGAHGTTSGTSCDPCWRWRAAHGCEFDARTKPQLEAAARKGAA